MKQRRGMSARVSENEGKSLEPKIKRARRSNEILAQLDMLELPAWISMIPLQAAGEQLIVHLDGFVCMLTVGHKVCLLCI